MFFTLVFGVDEDVIKVYYHKNIKLFYQDLIDITLKHGRYIGQSEKHDLIVKVTIVSLEGRFLFVAFSDPHSMLGIGQVKLDETSSPA